ncbi:host attachment protein [Prosthecomicrobium hirschii]|nr:host attachment protein [Prosthecomicrobium hirschii]MCW1840895.1 host attachment protein [Prosthecomicrobium hirschii]
MRRETTWVVVADGARARILEALGVGAGLRQIENGTMAGSRDLASEIGSDRPGRSYESVGGQHHAVEPHTPVRESLERAFIEAVIDRLVEAKKAGQFDRLVFVAAPHALGAFRALAPEALQQKVVGTLDKDLTREPNEAIAEAVRAFAPV